jgi:hypothetical protein
VGTVKKLPVFAEQKILKVLFESATDLKKKNTNLSGVLVVLLRGNLTVLMLKLFFFRDLATQ